MTEPCEPPYGHEPSAVAHRQVIRIGVILIALVVLATRLVHLALRYAAPHHAQVVARIATVPPEPRLEVHPSVDLARFDAQKNALLNSWNWIDPTQTVARIPIERAIALYAQQQADNAKSSNAPRRSGP